MERDPIKTLEKTTKHLNNSVGKITRPVLKRYPLLFAFLITFSIAAVFHGFNLLIDRVEIFNRHPSLLLLTGIIVLTFTGSLFKILEKKDMGE